MIYYFFLNQGNIFLFLVQEFVDGTLADKFRIDLFHVPDGLLFIIGIGRCQQMLDVFPNLGVFVADGLCPENLRIVRRDGIFLLVKKLFV